MFQDTHGVEQPFRPNPCSHAVQAADPCGQGRQAATEGRCVGEGAFDLGPCLVDPFSKGVLQQFDAMRAMRTLVMFAAAGVLGLSVRRYQLVASFKSEIVKVTGSVLAVGQQVPSVVQLADQTLRDFLFAGMQGGDFPRFGRYARGPNRMQLKSF